MLDVILPVLGGTAILLGLLLATVGLFGLLRRPDIFEQLHAAGLVTGPGVILVLLASIATGRPEIVTSAFLVIAFVLVTSSLSTHAIALAAWRQREGATATATLPIGATPGLDARANAEATPAPMRVLLAHDGSEGADVAVRLVASLPWPVGSMFRLITVMDGDLPLLSSVGAEPSGTDQGPTELSAALAAAGQALSQRGLTVEAVIRRGQPAAAIVEEAAALDAGLVVIGSRGLGWARSILVGSVAAGVVDRAPGPVLVARSTSLHEVLLAVDGTDSSAAAIEAVARWSIFDAVRIHVLSVATTVPQYGDVPGGMHELIETTRQQRVADAATSRLRKSGRRASSRVRTGDASAMILGVAGTGKIDLIVLGSRGRTGMRRALLGSVGREVLSSATTSILVVRAANWRMDVD